MLERMNEYAKVGREERGRGRWGGREVETAKSEAKLDVREA
jgi:hypothetical protein